MAAPKIHTNVGGVWKPVNKVHVNVGGAWKTVNKVHVNVGGVWKLAHGQTEYQRDTIEPMLSIDEFYGGRIFDGSFPPPSYEGTGVQMPDQFGWYRQQVGGSPNRTTALFQHVPPSWVPQHSNIHSVACDVAMMNYSYQSAGFHVGVLSRHPGINYNTLGNRCSAAVAGTYAGLNYALALENIEFGAAGSQVRDPWTVGSAFTAQNELYRRLEIHTRWNGTTSASRAILRTERGGAILRDSGWINIGGSYPTTFSDKNRNWIGVFFVLGNHTNDAFIWRRMRSSWSAGDTPLLEDL